MYYTRTEAAVSRSNQWKAEPLVVATLSVFARLARLLRKE